MHLGPVADLASSWGSVYANHPALRTAVSFAHFGGLLVGGGTAIAADTSTLRAYRHRDERDGQLRSLGRTHRTVLVAMAVITVSGLLLAAADLDTYVSSSVFWIKLALIGLLWLNGVLLLRSEARADRGDQSAWPLLRSAAASSLVLWMVITLFGAALPNVG